MSSPLMLSCACVPLSSGACISLWPKICQQACLSCLQSQLCQCRPFRPRTDPAAAHFLPALPAVHDALDPEMSILKQRLARRLRHDGATDESVKSIDLGEWQLGIQG